MTDQPALRMPAASRRCHWCGHSLEGLQEIGDCSKCRTAYTAESSSRLQPWPSAARICLRLGWPIIVLSCTGVIRFILGEGSGNYDSLLLGVYVINYAMIVAIALNSYLQVRSMLRLSLPEGVRTRGAVAILRQIGTLICAFILFVFVGLPLLFVGCLIIF